MRRQRQRKGTLINWRHLFICSIRVLHQNSRYLSYKKATRIMVEGNRAVLRENQRRAGRENCYYSTWIALSVVVFGSGRTRISWDSVKEEVVSPSQHWGGVHRLVGYPYRDDGPGLRYVVSVRQHWIKEQWKSALLQARWRITYTLTTPLWSYIYKWLIIRCKASTSRYHYDV